MTAEEKKALHDSFFELRLAAEKWTTLAEKADDGFNQGVLYLQNGWVIEVKAKDASGEMDLGEASLTEYSNDRSFAEVTFILPPIEKKFHDIIFDAILDGMMRRPARYGLKLVRLLGRP